MSSPRQGDRRRVVVTGMGAVTPLGNDVATFWRRLVAGESGVRRIESATLSAIAGKRAIAVAGLEPNDIDVIVVANLMPDYWMPSTPVLRRRRLPQEKVAFVHVAPPGPGLSYAGEATAATADPADTRRIRP